MLLKNDSNVNQQRSWMLKTDLMKNKIKRPASFKRPAENQSNPSPEKPVMQMVLVSTSFYCISFHGPVLLFRREEETKALPDEVIMYLPMYHACEPLERYEWMHARTLLVNCLNVCCFFKSSTIECCSVKLNGRLSQRSWQCTWRISCR